MQQLSSAITGALEAATPREQTGQRPGETGSGRSPTGVVAWLEHRAPEETDHGLRRSLASSLGVEVSLETAHRFPQDRPTFSEAVACHVWGLTAENCAAALAKIQTASTPAPREKLEDWLVALQAATARRSDDETTMGVALDVYAGALTRYPADVAKAACMNLAVRKGSPNWWPTLGELDAECQRLAKPRHLMLDAVRAWTPPTPEESSAETDYGRATGLRIQAMELRKSEGPGELIGRRREVFEQANALDREAWKLEKRARQSWGRR